MSNDIKRRQFLGQTVFGAAALAAATSTGTTGVKAAEKTATGATSKETSSERVVVGVMGLNRGTALATQFAQQAGVEIRYVCDVDTQRATEGATAVEKVGVARPQEIGDFRRILDDPEVDALVCAAPNHWHAPATILACSAGKHVYVEKPCSHNPREGELMVEAAQKYSRAVQMGSQRRSSPTIIKAIGMLREGKIGRVYSARAYYASARGSIGVGKKAEIPHQLDYELWQGPAPRAAYFDNRVHYQWHWFWHWGNGELGNNGVHTLDLCRWGLGVDFPIRVSSSGGRYRFDDDQQTPDTQAVGFEFADKKLITWQGQSCNRHLEDKFVLFYGEQGSLALASNGKYTFYDANNREIDSAEGTRGDTEHIANFLAAIRNNQPMQLNAQIEKGHKSTLLCHLGNIAHRTERTLNCDATNGHILDDQGAMAYWQREYEPGWEPKV